MSHAPHYVLPCKPAPKKKCEDHDKDDQGKRHLKKHHHKHHHHHHHHKHQHNCR